MLGKLILAYVLGIFTVLAFLWFYIDYRYRKLKKEGEE